MHQTTSLWPGLHTGSVSSSAMPRPRLSLPGTRRAHFTPRSSNAWQTSGLAKAGVP